MYIYLDEKEKLLTDSGQITFIKRRDAILRKMNETGAIRMNEALRYMGNGDSWEMLACMDRMKELGDIEELQSHYKTGQDRVFILKGSTLG